MVEWYFGEILLYVGFIGILIDKKVGIIIRYFIV